VLPKLTALDNEKSVIPCGSQEKVLSQIPLRGSKNRSDMKESKEPGEDGWGVKLGSSVVYYKNIGNQHSKKCYEREASLL